MGLSETLQSPKPSDSSSPCASNPPAPQPYSGEARTRLYRWLSASAGCPGPSPSPPPPSCCPCGRRTTRSGPPGRTAGAWLLAPPPCRGAGSVAGLGSSGRFGLRRWADWGTHLPLSKFQSELPQLFHIYGSKNLTKGGGCR